MKKAFTKIMLVTCILCLCGCGQSKTEPHIVHTFDTGINMAMFRPHYEMSDGTYMADDHIYQYKLEVTGRLNNAEMTTTYYILSNREDITFEEAWKASGLSSNLEDYFKPEDAVIVGAKLTPLEK